MEKKIYVIDGKDFNTLEGFYDQVSNILIPGAKWGRNFDAFNDILRGGFGTPEAGFILIWKNAEKSKDELSYKETLRWLREGIDKIDPLNIPMVEKIIELAEMNEGKTIFMTLVDIILNHPEIELRFE